MTLPERRVVRVAQAFFDQLDDLLPADRGEKGEPAAADFVVLDLPDIVERFAVGFDDLPETIDGLPTLRMLIASGLLVRAYAVYGALVNDDIVELIGITIDP